MSSSQDVRFAVVGTGLIGPRHADAILSSTGAQLVCIVDPQPSAAIVAAKLQCTLFPSVQAMLDDPLAKPDAALVCTPNHTHVAVSKELLQAGIHVLCEKPISIDVESGRELVLLPPACSVESRLTKSRSNAPAQTIAIFSSVTTDVSTAMSSQ
jgi:predicted dehydrogenase